ncbi:MAG: hypothetical protein JXA57_04400, partial [Armatimonadetes bacterium]|nr:hypothetical protein [Armatimonadota bacterium]
RKYDTPRLFTMQVDLTQHQVTLTVEDKELDYGVGLSEGIKRAFYDKVMQSLRPLLSSRGETRFEPVIDTVFFHDDAWSLRLAEEFINRTYPRRPFSSRYPVKQYTLLYKAPASIAEVLRNRLNPDAKVETDPYLNTISIAASDNDQEYAERLIGVLDIPPENTVVVRAFKLNYARAEEVASRINQLVKEAGELLEQQQERDRKAKSATETAPAPRSGIRAIGVEQATLAATLEQTAVLEQGVEAQQQGPLTPEPAVETAPSPIAQITGALEANAIADPGSNCVIVTTRAETLGVIQSLIKQLDVAPDQVLILAQILETTTDKLSDIGVDWNLEASISGSAVPVTFPFPRSSPDLARIVNSIDPSMRGPGQPWPESVDRVFPFASESDFTTGTLSFAKLAMTLKLLRDDSDTRLISAPQVATLSNQEANFLVETSFEYRKRTDVALGEGGQVAISYETAIAKDVIRLDVTPQITPDGKIIMMLRPEVSNVVRFDLLTNADGTEDKLPITTTRKTVTRVIVPNGRTLVLSGLIQNKDALDVSGVPGVSKIPVVGNAFKKELKETSKRNLVFFITPIVMKEGSDYLTELTRARVDFWEGNQDPWSAIQNQPH